VEHATLTKAAKDAASIDLTAVLVAVTDEEPRVLTIKDGKALPSGPFASSHRSLQTGVRSWLSAKRIIRSAISSSSTRSPTGIACLGLQTSE
jgi:hypothetical protein